ncbi:hypothetical protein [Streptomyces sp. SHP 1-2]|uniref:hypothetical protein n=1 Tax=Streptomyces sp. SHP 1-2 TaxID=2769489 RepID=UPI0022387F53|nr:hypothetical protein [Streptomyces sp. SHP 1-2]MCW5251404.1 hypothetical protein [Streptomyces sp. SHP 1-2]
MLELLPGTGAVLPGTAGTLGFGMTPDEAAATLAAVPGAFRSRQCTTLTRAGYPELRHAHDAWLTGILFDGSWNIAAPFGDVVLTVAGGGPGRTDRLTAIRVEASARTGARTTTPVVWDGVDLFGNPARDVASVLPGPLRPSAPGTADLTAERLGLWLGERPRSPSRWSRAVLLRAPTGWERCCAGTFACARGGDGLTGILF